MSIEKFVADLNNYNMDGKIFSRPTSNKAKYNTSLQGINLSYSLHKRTYHLKEVTFERYSFKKADLYYCHFTKSKFIRVDFSQANLGSIECDQCIFIECEFNASNLSFANFRHCRFIDCKFKTIEGERVTFQECEFYGCSSFSDCRIMYSSFDGCKGIGLDFRKSRIRGSSFDRAVLINGGFYQVCLEGAYMCNAILTRSNFSGANLNRLSIWGTKIDFCYLGNANLENIDPDEDTDFTGSNFDDAIFLESQREKLITAKAAIEDKIGR